MFLRKWGSCSSFALPMPPGSGLSVRTAALPDGQACCRNAGDESKLVQTRPAYQPETALMRRAEVLKLDGFKYIKQTEFCIAYG